MSDDQHGEVSVHIGSRGFVAEIEAGEHRAISDEPVERGGTNQGPSPYDYLLASLGSCTAITLRMFADRKQWPLQGVDVRLRHSRIHAEDCDDCERKTGKIDVIERVITLHGPLDPEQLARLQQVADHCPVHKTLTNEIKIRTRFVS
ncbi:MAG: OsmC family protein [Polyangiales bacterium]